MFSYFRFGAGTKIADNFYARQDGTRTYFFQVPELGMLSQNILFWRRILLNTVKSQIPAVFSCFCHLGGNLVYPTYFFLFKTKESK